MNCSLLMPASLPQLDSVVFWTEEERLGGSKMTELLFLEKVNKKQWKNRFSVALPYSLITPIFAKDTPWHCYFYSEGNAWKAVPARKWPKVRSTIWPVLEAAMR